MVNGLLKVNTFLVFQMTFTIVKQSTAVSLYLMKHFSSELGDSEVTKMM